jgi:hypothetical protein
LGRRTVKASSRPHHEDKSSSKRLRLGLGARQLDKAASKRLIAHLSCLFKTDPAEAGALHR